MCKKDILKNLLLVFVILDIYFGYWAINTFCFTFFTSYPVPLPLSFSIILSLIFTGCIMCFLINSKTIRITFLLFPLVHTIISFVCAWTGFVFGIDLLINIGLGSILSPPFMFMGEATGCGYIIASRDKRAVDYIVIIINIAIIAASINYISSYHGFHLF